MTLLDSLGRDTSITWKANALLRWIYNPRIRRVLPKVLHEGAIIAYIRGQEIEQCEPIVEAEVKRCLANRVTRRVIAAQMVKDAKISRKDAMAALLRMSE